MEFRDGCKKLGLPLTETEQDAVADRFALIGDSRRVNYYEVLQWVASGATTTSSNSSNSNNMYNTGGWHSGNNNNSNSNNNERRYDIMGSVEASDDYVWNSKTVSGWLVSATPQRWVLYHSTGLYIEDPSL